jgi:hypothetical protein
MLIKVCEVLIPLTRRVLARSALRLETDEGPGCLNVRNYRNPFEADALVNNI